MKAILVLRGPWLLTVLGALAGACSGVSATLPSLVTDGGGTGSNGGGSSGAPSASSSGGFGGSSGFSGSTGSSSGAGSSSGGREGGSGRPDSGPVVDSGSDGSALSFAANVYPILAQRCTLCHGPGGSGFNSGMLDLMTNQAMGAYAELMMNAMGVVAGRAGTTCAASGWARVARGSATTSLLFAKVNGKAMGVAAPCGNTMPPSGSPPLSAAQIATIENWINQGANP